MGSKPTKAKAGPATEISSDWEDAAPLVATTSPLAATIGNQELRVAVIGTGVAGLGAAWHLSKTPNVELAVFEAADRAGGHANTVTIQLEDGTDLAVDTGFMVYNHQNYPNLVRLFEALGVGEEETDMSFSVSLDKGATEWSSQGLGALFATGSNAVSPRFYGMLRAMLRFNREAPLLLALDDSDPRKSVTVGEYLKQNGYPESFASLYLVPMAAALWSSSSADVMAFSAVTMISFFHNHNMLQLFGRPQWKTPAGRSTQYVQAICGQLGDRLHLDTAITKVARNPEGGWTLTDNNFQERTFDQVVMACHADQSLRLLGEQATQEEHEVLGVFKFAENVTYVHSDEALMPRRRKAWASWNYLGAPGSKQDSATKPVFVTYWLNRLQNLKCRGQVFLSLNPPVKPDPAKVHRRLRYSHPQFTPQGQMAQTVVLERLNGKRGLWFCGAWLGYGFHEDGLRTGLEAATRITGSPVSWVGRAAQGAQLPRHLVVPQRQLPLVLDMWRGATNALQGIISQLALKLIIAFLRRSITKGLLVIKCPDGREFRFGDKDATADNTVAVKVYDWWFFVRVALEYDLGLARSYMAGEWVVDGDNKYADGLRRLLLLFVDNRDAPKGLRVNQLLTAWLGYGLNFLRYKLSLDNSITGSRSNIEAHYDLSNDLFKTFLDRRLMMYSSAIYDAETDPGRPGCLRFKDTLEEAQLRKVDTLIARARIKMRHRLLDIGFGWGGVAIRAAETIGCRVHGITLSKEQKALAEQKVLERGLSHLVTFELVDYRVFARRHPGEFDRIISCEMIEAVGHNYLGTYFRAVDTLLAPDGIFVMEAITTPESRYKEYLKSTDFINTIIFPGSCCPSLTALLSAMANNSDLSLEGYDNIAMHYAETLREWRVRFNDNADQVRSHGFDSTFIRCWNYYFSYCEAGFHSRTEGCLILTFSRPGNPNLLPAHNTRYLVSRNS